MNDKYLRLGRAIAGQCPVGFEQAKLSGRIEEGKAEVNIAAVMADGTEFEPGLDDAARAEIEAALHDVRDAQAAEDGKTWRTCTVTLIKGGGFTMDVGD
ncbi:hypothetical protein RCO27_05380 [Sphingosinicella sp. LHD-64]|uniref:hypothetical protein n=1 Tax=Sphingosinicella sp. LHD-64 TaxID=3072139 RepID=UPI00280F0D68|nr:hypothetical protein [Sphingosinicella sp. LHD-64]MDQ8755654.1 hypothetical protein [Sphingosinicella sp. LHD-64]